jgi:hypothetical protein
MKDIQQQIRLLIVFTFFVYSILYLLLDFSHEIV